MFYKNCLQDTFILIEFQARNIWKIVCFFLITFQVSNLVGIAGKLQFKLENRLHYWIKKAFFFKKSIARYFYLNWISGRKCKKFAFEIEFQIAVFEGTARKLKFELKIRLNYLIKESFFYKVIVARYSYHN